MARKTILESIEVKSPCSESWNEMEGNDKVRFCSHCSKDVNNISRMTRKEARRLVANSGGNLCIRYENRPDGSIRLLKSRFHQIKRRAGIAAGVLSASLAISAAAHAQNQGTQPEGSAAVVRIRQADSPISGKVAGTLTDQNGAVVQYALVTLMNDSGYYRTTNSDAGGRYEFLDVPEGSYSLKIDAGGFEAKEIKGVSVSDGFDINQDAQLAIAKVEAVVTVGGEEVYTTQGSVGVMIACSEPRNGLVMAVENEDLDEVKARIAMGERVNARDKGYDGNTPLHVAVENGNLEIAELLLRSGAKTGAKNFEKKTPLMMLDSDAPPELIDLLLRYRAKVNIFDKLGNTPLIIAAGDASEEVVTRLIQAGANINAANKAGETALMKAADEEETENAKILLGAGANANARCKNGKTALSRTGNGKLRQVLIAYGASE